MKKGNTLSFKLRRKFTKLITAPFSKNGFKNRKLSFNTVNPKVLIVRPNHRLGNQLMLSPLIQELEQQFPNVEIDLFVKGGLCYILYAENKSIKNIISLPKKHFNELLKYINSWFKIINQRYDLVINISPSSSSGKLATRLTKANFKIYSIPENVSLESKHMALIPVELFRKAMKIWGVPVSDTPFPNMELRLSEIELQKGKQKLLDFTNQPEKTIAIYTFATGAKCKDHTWWVPFYEKLIKQFPEYTIIEILPVENVSQINFAAPNYYSKDLREIAAATSQVALWIGTDSGMMHVAAATPTTVIGLFSVTDPEIYGPYRKGSLSVNIDKVSQDFILDKIEDVLSFTD